MRLMGISKQANMRTIHLNLNSILPRLGLIKLGAKMKLDPPESLKLHLLNTMREGFTIYIYEHRFAIHS